jgi:hypothetical protein
VCQRETGQAKKALGNRAQETLPKWRSGIEQVGAFLCELGLPLGIPTRFSVYPHLPASPLVAAHTTGDADHGPIVINAARPSLGIAKKARQSRVAEEPFRTRPREPALDPSVGRHHELIFHSHAEATPWLKHDGVSEEYKQQLDRIVPIEERHDDFTSEPESHLHQRRWRPHLGAHRDRGGLSG